VEFVTLHSRLAERATTTLIPLGPASMATESHRSGRAQLLQLLTVLVAHHMPRWRMYSSCARSAASNTALAGIPA